VRKPLEGVILGKQFVRMGGWWHWLRIVLNGGIWNNVDDADDSSSVTFIDIEITN
jgi:hypothetical protein